MKIAILALPQFFPTALIGLRDLFWIAHQAADFFDVTIRQEIELEVVSIDGNNVIDGFGHTYEIGAKLEPDSGYTAVLIPGLTERKSDFGLELKQERELTRALNAYHLHGGYIGASCAGVFALAATGLLNGKQCTTTWWLYNELVERYPKTKCQWGAGLTEHGRLTTVGGPMSWVDLGLHIIRKFAGNELAKVTADFSVIDNHSPSQLIFAPQNYIKSESSFIVDLESLIRNSVGKVSVSIIADKLNMSTRTLARKVQKLTGESPSELITRVKLDIAKVMLERNEASIVEVSEAIGYFDHNAFRKAFKRRFNQSPSNYKKWHITR